MVSQLPLEKFDPEIYQLIQKENQRVNETIELIASENFAGRAVMEAQGSILTNKYAEGYPGKRYYAGCVNMDGVESIAKKRAQKLFGADHVNVQPHSGTQANVAVYLALLKPGDKIMGMELAHGGHLTHGSPVNISGQIYQSIPYCVDKNTETLNYEEIGEEAKKKQPNLIIIGASAYPRIIDFPAFRKIADECGAYLLADIAHIAGLVVTGLHPDPIPYCDVVTSTTHKTLGGPRGGIIMCKSKYAPLIDKAMFPGSQGGPLMHVIAAKAVCFKEAFTDEFKHCQQQIVKNARCMADELLTRGYRLVSGGTDNHLFLVDLSTKGLTGAEVESALDSAGITVNKNRIPFDTKGADITSGIRIGSSSVATRGMKEAEMKIIAGFIDEVITHIGDKKVYQDVRAQVKKLCLKYPVYP
ncbi:MAG: serine hydroxymethyltransferase [bacterium]